MHIGITLVGILAGAFGGATLAEAIADGLEQIPALAPYGEAIGLAVVVVFVTYLSLVIGELAPKRLALSNPEQVAARVARPMRFLSRLASPAVRLLSSSTDVLLLLLRVRPTPEAPVSAEEIKILVEQGASSWATRTATFQPATAAWKMYPASFVVAICWPNCWRGSRSTGQRCRARRYSCPRRRRSWTCCSY